MITRRDCVLTLGAELCWCACTAAHAQWPQGAPSNRVAPDFRPQLSGCMNGHLDQVQQEWEGLRPEDTFVAETFQHARRILGVGGLIAVFDGPDSYNALASPGQFILSSTQADNRGSVFIGRQLILNEQTQRGVAWKKSVAMIIAHESSHLLQYKRRLNLPTLQMELHADFLAGWTLGELRRTGRGNLVDLRAVDAALRSLSTREFGSPTVHGNAEQRIWAIHSGFRYAEDGFDTPPFDEGVQLLRGS